jgi:polyphosphate glucokinase
MEILGLDVGGSGIKGAPVNMETGELLTKRFRIPTPQPATPDAMIAVAADVVAHFNWKGQVGCGFPAVVKAGTVHTAANIASEWIGVNIDAALQQATGCPVHVINDADAAGLAELRWGAGREVDGLVLMVTLGTGIGTALFIQGQLVPNTELGHIEMRGRDAETWASDRVREQEELSWEEFAERVNEYLCTIERLLWPDLIVVGGGVSKHAAKFFPMFTTRTSVVPAQMRNNAGIAGAALAATLV